MLGYSQPLGLSFLSNLFLAKLLGLLLWKGSSMRRILISLSLFSVISQDLRRKREVDCFLLKICLICVTITNNSEIHKNSANGPFRNVLSQPRNQPVVILCSCMLLHALSQEIFDFASMWCMSRIRQSIMILCPLA